MLGNSVRTANALTAAMLGVVFTVAASGLFGWPAMAQTNRATFPKNFNQYVLYATYDRGSSKEEAFATPETLAIAPGTALSRAGESRLPLTWIALLHGRIDASLAATTGVEGSTELIKYLLAGADVVMTASALLRHGPHYAAVILDGLRDWMARKGYLNIDEVRGLLAVPIGADEAAHERGDYVSALRQANSADFGPW